jgi:cytochrome c
MHSLTAIRAAGCLIMLVFAGVVAMPLTAHAQGDAAAGEKVFAHCAACHSNKPGEKKIRTVIGRCGWPQERDGARL